MVKIWYMNENPTDPTAENHLEPPYHISLAELVKLTGVEYIQLNASTYATDGQLDQVRKERGYSYEDEITCSKECLPNFEEKLKTFFEEHLHTDEEIRFVVDGSGYFDVRDVHDKWIRILVVPGDLIIIPAGIYHRFTMDSKKYIKAKRLFVGEPVWKPHNRPAEEMQCRKQYLEKLNSGAFIKAH